MELYLEQMRKKYKKAKKHEKGLLLDELCSISGYHKKHAIRVLNHNIRVKKGVKENKVGLSVIQNRFIYSH